jgi:HEAT repeats
LVRTPLLLSIVTHAYKDNASSLRALSNLKAASGELRDRIFEDYVKSRFVHEQRHENAALPFSIEDVYRLLGQAVLDGTEYVLAGHTEYAIDLETAIKARVGERIAIFVEEVTRLHLLIRGPEQRLTFIHALLHDHFGFRYALAFLTSNEFGTSKYDLRNRTLEFLAKSDDPRALEPLIEQLEPYICFPLVYSLRVGDPRVLLAYARSLEVDDGDAKYDLMTDVTPVGIRVVAEKLGHHTSAWTLGSAAQSATADRRAVYLYALAFLRLKEGLDTIVSATQDSDATVRGVAVWALGELGRPETLDVVERLLTDDHVVEDWISWDPAVKDWRIWGNKRFHFPWSSRRRFPSLATRVSDLAHATLTKLRSIADGCAKE